MVLFREHISSQLLTLGTGSYLHIFTGVGQLDMNLRFSTSSIKVQLRVWERNSYESDKVIFMPTLSAV